MNRIVIGKVLEKNKKEWKIMNVFIFFLIRPRYRLENLTLEKNEYPANGKNM